MDEAQEKLDQDELTRFMEVAGIRQPGSSLDERVLSTLLEPLGKSETYHKQESPQADVFQSWWGLDHRVVQTARRVAGQTTSVYRQIGLGCERVCRIVISEQLGVPMSETTWGYYSTEASRTLDAKIPLSSVTKRRTVLDMWLGNAGHKLNFTATAGVVFEIRQGHKSGDSKRQVADRDNARQARNEGLLPVLLVFSNQLPEAARNRYTRDGWLILLGTVGGSSVESTYTFFRDVLDYDIAGFFEKNQELLRTKVMDCLLHSSAVQEKFAGLLDF